MTVQKRCGKCGQVKEAEYFYRASRARDGLHWMCIRCCRAYKRSEANRAYDRLRCQRRKATAA